MKAGIKLTRKFTIDTQH